MVVAPRGPTFNTKEQAVALTEGELPFTDPAVAKAFEPEQMMQDAGLFERDRFTTPFFNEATAASPTARAR